MYLARQQRPTKMAEARRHFGWKMALSFFCGILCEHKAASRVGGFGVIGTLMLVCAVLASLALGVLVAYGICQTMFRIFRVHAQSAARARVVGQNLRAVRS